MGLIDFLNVLLRLNIPLFSVLMFMKGQKLCCHPGSREMGSGLTGSLPVLGGLLTPPAVLPERSNDSGYCSPPETFTEEGVEGDLTCVSN